jgi:hypothetical protein
MPGIGEAAAGHIIVPHITFMVMPVLPALPPAPLVPAEPPTPPPGAPAPPAPPMSSSSSSAPHAELVTPSAAQIVSVQKNFVIAPFLLQSIAFVHRPHRRHPDAHRSRPHPVPSDGLGPARVACLKARRNAPRFRPPACCLRQLCTGVLARLTGGQLPVEDPRTLGPWRKLGPGSRFAANSKAGFRPARPPGRCAKQVPAREARCARLDPQGFIRRQPPACH